MSYTPAEIETKIAALDAAIQSGVTSVTTDGTTTSVSLEQMRVERKELRRLLAQSQQPVAMTVDLSHG